MMNLLDPDIPLDYLLPMSLPYSKSYKSGILFPLYSVFNMYTPNVQHERIHRVSHISGI